MSPQLRVEHSGAYDHVINKGKSKLKYQLHRSVDQKAEVISATEVTPGSTVAGRLAGAFRNIGKNAIADNIIETMKAAGHSIIECPF